MAFAHPPCLCEPVFLRPGQHCCPELPFERSFLVLDCLTKFLFSSFPLLPFPVATDSTLCQNRGRLAEKRTIPLPPTRIPKKELTSIFSHSDDSEESDKGNGQHPEVKQEEDLHISIMKRRYFPARECWHCKSKDRENWAAGDHPFWVNTARAARWSHLQGLKFKCKRPIIVQEEQLDTLLCLLTPVWGEQGSKRPCIMGLVFALKASAFADGDFCSILCPAFCVFVPGEPVNRMTKNLWAFYTAI